MEWWVFNFGSWSVKGHCWKIRKSNRKCESWERCLPSQSLPTSVSLMQLTEQYHHYLTVGSEHATNTCTVPSQCTMCLFKSINQSPFSSYLLVKNILPSLHIWYFCPLVSPKNLAFYHHHLKHRALKICRGCWGNRSVGRRMCKKGDTLSTKILTKEK